MKAQDYVDAHPVQSLSREKLFEEMLKELQSMSRGRYFDLTKADSVSGHYASLLNEFNQKGNKIRSIYLKQNESMVVLDLAGLSENWFRTKCRDVAMALPENIKILNCFGKPRADWRPHQEFVDSYEFFIGSWK